jgi:hypothetical protein
VSSEAPKNPQHFSPQKRRKKRNASNHTIFSDNVPPFER